MSTFHMFDNKKVSYCESKIYIDKIKLQMNTLIGSNSKMNE